VLLETDAAMLATQLLKSSATLAAKGLPVRIKVRKDILLSYHTQSYGFTYTSTDFTVGKKVAL